MNNATYWLHHYIWWNFDRWSTIPEEWLPFLGKYDSTDEYITQVHVSWMKWMGISALVSWWPGEHSEAKELFVRVATAMKLPFAWYFEGMGKNGWNWSDGALRKELKKMDTSSPMYVHRNNKPFVGVFCYPNDEQQFGQLIKVGRKFHLSLRALQNWETPRVLKQIKGKNISLHNYQVNERALFIPNHNVMITAGGVQVPRNIELFKLILETAGNLDVQDITVISNNEHHEFSGIEIGTSAYGIEYMEAIKNLGL